MVVTRTDSCVDTEALMSQFHMTAIVRRLSVPRMCECSTRRSYCDCVNSRVVTASAGKAAHHVAGERGYVLRVRMLRVRSSSKLPALLLFQLRVASSSALPFVALAQVLGSPEWSQVRVMKASGLLLWIEQVEADAWANVIEVPLAVIVPVHAKLETVLDVDAKLRHGAADQRGRVANLARSLQSAVQTRAIVAE